MSETAEIVIEREDGFPQTGRPDQQEDGVDVPFNSIHTATLHNLIAEFVTREWEELGDSNFSLDDKIKQVLRQLHEKKAKVVFDLTTKTCNIVPWEGK